MGGGRAARGWAGPFSSPRSAKYAGAAPPAPGPTERLRPCAVLPGGSAAPAPGLPRALPHGGAVVFASSSAYKRFSELLPREQRENACSVRVPKSQILTLPELRVRYLEWGGWAGSPAEPSPCSPWIASSAPCRAPPCDGTAVPGGMGRDQSGALLLVGRCQPCPQPSPSRQANPFQHRICHVFSTSEDGDDSMSFEDFLDMLSVFSDAATSDIKSRYAFRIFGNPGCDVVSWDPTQWLGTVGEGWQCLQCAHGAALGTSSVLGAAMPMSCPSPLSAWLT